MLHAQINLLLKVLIRRKTTLCAVWGANLADMQLISKYNNGFGLLLNAIDIFSKYAWVVLVYYAAN